MDFQEYIDDMNKIRKFESAKEYNLGELINDLEKLPEEKIIYIDFENEIGVCKFGSWRGSYCELSLEYGKGYKVKVLSLLENAKECINKEFTGYKGGDFVMDKLTPIHIANYGESSCYLEEFHNKEEGYRDCAKLIGVEEFDDYCKLILRKD